MSLDDIICQKAGFLRETGLLSEARMLLQGHLTEHPDSAAILRLLGETCGMQGDYSAAATHLEAATAMEPQNLEGHFLLGVAYENLGKYEQALVSFQRVRQISPQMALPFRWMGLVLARLGRNREAMESYHEALRIDPAYSEAMIGLASLLILQHRLEEAESLLSRVLSAEPGNNSGLNELSRLYRLQGRGRDSVALLRKALQAHPTSRMFASNLLFALCDLPDIAPEDVAAEHFKLADQCYPPEPDSCPLSPRSATSKLHIGYMSGDFFTHSVAFFIEPLLATHDYAGFSVYCYSNTRRPDETTARLRTYPVTWRDIRGMSAEAVTATIRNDGIDILVELSGHTAGNRLDVCALKPAPIIVSWLGYPHSTGLRQIDYYLTDSLCDPPGITEHLYREKLWRLPGIFCCYRPPDVSPEITLPGRGGNIGVTFGCFNNFWKVTDSMLMLWGELLRRVEGSVLLLKSHGVSELAVQQRVRRLIAAAGADPDRVRFHAYTETRHEHLELYGGVDIALDTYPYNGTTTTCEALYMGVPVITLAGRTHASRVGVSLLSAVGLADLIAETPEQYAEKAILMASDAEGLANLRKNLRPMMISSPLMDTSEVTRNVEATYRQMALGKTHGAPSPPVPETSPEFIRLLNEGHLLFEQDRYEEAVNVLLQAAAKEPTSARCRLLLGSALLSTGRSEEALHHFRHLLRLESGQLADLGSRGSDAFTLAATAAYECGRESYAVDLCRQAVQQDPSNFMARLKQCLYTLKMCASGEDTETIRQQYAAELDAFVGVDLAADADITKAVAAVGEMTPFLLAYLGLPVRHLQETYGKWLCSLMSRKHGDSGSGPIENRRPHDRIRVGFVSGHFYLHSVWKIITSGWLKNLDRTGFEIFGYYPGTVTDHVTEEAQALTSRFVRTTSVDELVQAIRDDEIDVLIYPGIGMDPYTQQLAALRLAPVQCASWGHPLTTGMPTVDFFLSSALMEPEDGEAQYSEKLVRLPNLSVCYADVPPVCDPGADLLLPNASAEDVLYLCCQNLHKYLPQHDDIFPAIASRVDKARFIFVNTHPALGGRFMDRMKRCFEACSLSAENHVVMLPKLTTARYNALNSTIDIYLDNLEWSGGNTTLESLPFNKPIVTMPGRFMRGRHTAAILEMMGVTETIARTKEEYVALAVQLGNDTSFRKAIAERIRHNKHMIYDDQCCITALESFLKEQSISRLSKNPGCSTVRSSPPAASPTEA